MKVRKKLLLLLMIMGVLVLGLSSPGWAAVVTPEEFKDSVRVYPNPATDDQVTFRCYVDEVPATVTIRVYTIMGEEVWSSTGDVNTVGVYTKVWDLENNDGSSIASNLLIYRIELEDPSETKKLTKKLIVGN